MNAPLHSVSTVVTLGVTTVLALLSTGTLARGFRYFFQLAITIRGNMPPVLAMLSSPSWNPSSFSA